ncbi:MAG: STAS domain-containing protein [Oscillospiraceae bacterium]|nr:STAS domain-containing protein [Oscillospiraceae bacterium]
MPVTVKHKNGVMKAFIKGDIDHHTVPEIRDTIDEAFLTIDSVELLVLDFDGVTFMDSSGVGLVMGRFRLVSGKGKKLQVDNLSERDYRIMKMSGIEKLATVNKKGELK